MEKTEGMEKTARAGFLLWPVVLPLWFAMGPLESHGRLRVPESWVPSRSTARPRRLHLPSSRSRLALFHVLTFCCAAAVIFAFFPAVPLSLWTYLPTHLSTYLSMRPCTIAAGQAGLAGLVAAVSTFSPARPPAIPLAVRAPYLNSWLPAGNDDGGNGGYLAGEWAKFWTQQITGWQGFVRVDGRTYNWMGNAPGAQSVIDQTSFSYTSTRSTFVMKAGGKVGMNVTFLSPVTPNDLRRQSLTFSYLEVDVYSLDGRKHSVELYADVSGEWAGDVTQVIEWDHNSTDGVSYHTFARRNQVEIAETGNMANWGTWYWSTTDVAALTYQSGADVVVRDNFLLGGKLANSKDSNYRAINSNYPVFGFARSLGDVGTASVPVLFSLGLTQDNAIKLLGEGDTLTTIPSLWKSYFSSSIEALTFFHKDYPTAAQLATELDNKIATDSVAAAGQKYLTITSLSVRQTFGALQFTGTDSRPQVFLKEISSNSDIQTVDVIFPSMPLMLYTNPRLLAYMLDPLFSNQENGHYPKRNAIHDLGTFPLAAGYPDGADETMPLEECGNMIIMALAYAQRSGDDGYLAAHYGLLNQWAGYLVNESLIPANQISTDDFAGPLANQTNLALKGIIGLRAMSEVAARVNNSNDAAFYRSTAATYITEWQKYAVDEAARPAHTKLAYQNATSWGLLYNLYAADLLALDDLVPRAVYDMQSAFYPTVRARYGVPLDTRHSWTKTDWMLFCAAVAGDDTKRMFVDAIADWIDATDTDRALTDLYDVHTGEYPGITFVARPVAGAHFSLLALPPKK